MPAPYISVEKEILFFATEVSLLGFLNLTSDAEAYAVAKDTKNTFFWTGSAWQQANIAPTQAGTVGSHALDGVEHGSSTLPVARLVGHDKAAHAAIGVFNDTPVYTEAVRGALVAINPLSPPFRMPHKFKIIHVYGKVETAPSASIQVKLRKGTPPTGTVIDTLTITNTNEVISTVAANQDILAGDRIWWSIEAANGAADLRLQLYGDRAV